MSKRKKLNKIAPNVDFLIGVDTGIHTGFAVLNRLTRKFIYINTLTIHQAMSKICLMKANGFKIHVFVEDARLLKYTKEGREEGVGSVKRDARVWEDFLQELKVDFTLTYPDKNFTKMKERMFQHMTGWRAPTSDHARDAAMIVFHRK